MMICAATPDTFFFSFCCFDADGFDGAAQISPAERKPSGRRHHGKHKPKYKSAMKVKITDRVRQKREAKALREKQSKLTPETIGPLHVADSISEKQPQEAAVRPEIVKERVPEVIYKDKYDIIKERRAREFRASQEQRTLSPSKSKEGTLGSPKKQSRQRHTSASSQKKEKNVSVLRSSESEEEGALKQQALEALLKITGEEFKTMNTVGSEQNDVSTLGDAIVTPHTPPSVLNQRRGSSKRDINDTRLMQFANSAQQLQTENWSHTHQVSNSQSRQGEITAERTRPVKDSLTSRGEGEIEVRSNQKQGKHVCDCCGRRCSKPSVLKKHIRSHTGERPYPCDPCGISFKTKSNLYKHCKSHAHAAKAGASSLAPDLKALEFENDSGSDETDTDEEGDKEGVKDLQAQTQPHSQSSSLPVDSQQDRVKMTQTSVQKVVNGGRSSMPDSLPSFVPSSKTQASPVASQTGNMMWAPQPSMTHHIVDKHLLQEEPHTMKLMGGQQRKHSPQNSATYNQTPAENNGSTSSKESGIQFTERWHSAPISHLGEREVSHPSLVSADRSAPSKGGHVREEGTSQDADQQKSSQQIMIPLTNFNIVKSGGQYHFQIPVDGIPGLSEEVLKNQGVCLESDKTSSRDGGEKPRPTLNSPSKQIRLQQHIQKLITQNEAIVDDSDLESVKPRRPSFSYRESMTSTPPQLPSNIADPRCDSKSTAESSAVAMEIRRRPELAEQTNLDSKQEVRGNQDRQREAQSLKRSQHAAHQHTGQPRVEPPHKPTEGGISSSHKLPTSSPSTLQQAVPGDGNTIRNILLQHKLTQHTPPASMLGQSLPMERQQYSPLWPPAHMVAPWMLKEALQGGMRYPMPAMYHHPSMMQHLPTESLAPGSASHQFPRESPHGSHHADSGKSAHKRKKSKSESDSAGSQDPHHAKKKVRKHHDHTPIHEEEMPKALPHHGAAQTHSMLPMFSPPFPGPDANHAASQLMWLHPSLPKGTSTPLRSPYSPKSSKVPETSYPGVSVIQHTPTTPHAPSQFSLLPGQPISTYGPEKSDTKRESPGASSFVPRESKSPVTALYSTTGSGSTRSDFLLSSPSLQHSPRHEGLLKVAPPQSPLTPKTPGLASPRVPNTSFMPDKGERLKETPNLDHLPVNEALARKKKSFTLALDENSARVSLQKRRNLPAIPGLNMSPGRSLPAKRTPSEQTHALDLTAKILGSPLSAKIPRVDVAGRSPAHTPTEGGKKFPKSPMKFGSAAARHRLSLDLPQPLTAAVKSASTPDGPKSSPKIDPRVLLSPEALSIAESVMKMSQSPLKAKTPSTPVDAARELGRLVAHAFHNAGGSIESILTTSNEGVIVGPIATPTADGKPKSQFFVLPSPSSSHAPSFPSSSSPRSEKSPLTPSDKLSPTQGKLPPGQADSVDSQTSSKAEFLTASGPVKLSEEDSDSTGCKVQPIKTEKSQSSPSLLKPQTLEQSNCNESSVGEHLLEVLTPVLHQTSLKSLPQKLEKSLADWFSSVKTNKAGSGPALAPTFLYANISSRMKGVAQVTDCCSRRLQPMYVPQGSNRKISMYSNWRPGGNTKHPLGVSWKAHLGLYNSGMNKGTLGDVTCSISPAGGGILTHSSAWNMSAEKIKAASEEIHTHKISSTANVSPAETPMETTPPAATSEAELPVDKPSKGKEPKRIPIFEGGYKSNEEYVYVRGRGRGKYVCQECGIRCKKPSMLKKHIRTHTDVRPFQCNVCSFAFKTKGNLTKHMKSKAHTKKCLENGINPSELEQEHGIDSSAYDESDDHQYSDADENEDTDSADDSEEEEMDDGMGEETEMEDDAFHSTEEQQDAHHVKGDSIPHPGKLKRSYSEILKPHDLQDVKEDQLPSSKLSRSEVVCKLSQHLTNRQRAHTGHPPLTKSQSLSHLPLSGGAFLGKSPSQKSQPPPVLDKYGHIVSLQSYAPCTNHYRLATGNTAVSAKCQTTASTTSTTAQGVALSSGVSKENRDDLGSEESPPTSTQLSTGKEGGQKQESKLSESVGSSLPLVENINKSSHSRDSELSSMSVPMKPHESLMRRPERSDSSMRYYSSSSHHKPAAHGMHPIIEPVSDDEEDSSGRKSGQAVSSVSGSSKATAGQIPIMEPSGNAIKQLLLSKPPLWPSAGDQSPVQKSPLQKFVSPFLPPSIQAPPIPSPTHLKPFSPGPYHRLVSPMLPSKMFQLPPTILSTNLPSGSGSPKPTAHAEREVATSPTTSEGERSSLTSPALSSPTENVSRDKQSGDSLADDGRPKVSEEERMAMSPTGSTGHHRCIHCGEAFIKPSQLRIHARVHAVEATFTCHECLVSFSSRNLLSKHERSEEHFARVEGVELATTTGVDSNPRPFKCKECAIAFRIPGHLAKHLRSKGHLMTLERQGKLPAHKHELLHLHGDGGEDVSAADGEQKVPGSPASSEKTDSASEAEEGKS
ncbi:uncharacterized protein [Diadema antillarum]|uniref:uncharacterized protein n=1 Tax=Diadema antillarum TaxID=105358 RepID=UPI003A86D11A